MTQIAPAQPPQSSQSRSTIQPAAEMDDLTFAKLLAATVQQETESSLMTSATPSSSPMNSLQQLAFLNQPAAMPLPSFMLNLWQPKTIGNPPVTTTAAVSGRAAEFNPYSSALADLAASGTPGINATTPRSAVAPTSAVEPSRTALPLSAFPRPAGDTGRGIHWIPTTSQSHEVIDKYVAEAADMGIK